jgi:pyruvate dehydrogenase E2 component (dihydrolipoamide acetyltransferase)
MANVILPELGEGITSVEISDVVVQKGSTISVDDILIVVETDKASMEIPSTEAGLVDSVHVQKGDSISPGDNIITLSATGDTPSNDIGESDTKPNKAVEEKPTQQKNEPVPIVDSPKESTVLDSKDSDISVSASPGVRRFARELGCDITEVSGTGPKGRITKEDVQNFVKETIQQPAPEEPLPTTSPAPSPSTVKKPEIDFTQWGDVSQKSLSKIKRITGQRLQESWQTIPHVTQFDKADITELDDLRKSLKKLNKNPKIKVSHIPFYMKAVVKTLQKYPEFNSSLSNDGENLIYKKFFNIGIAVDTPNGLVVPVIKDVDKKSFKQLTLELSQMSIKAREGKLTLADMQGGCFTISSLGGVGGTYFTPIINPPEVAILGISRMEIEPVFKNKKFHPRKILPYSLSYDHRVIDGIAAVNFTRTFASYLENLNLLK